MCTLKKKKKRVYIGRKCAETTEHEDAAKFTLDIKSTVSRACVNITNSCLMDKSGPKTMLHQIRGMKCVFDLVTVQ